MELVDRTEKVLVELGTRFEMIMVEDGSSDDSWKQVRLAAEGRPWVVPIRLTRNYGQHNALLCGLRRAQFSNTVTMDDDLQHPPEQIPKLLRGLADADVIYGTPTQQRHGFLRNAASRAIKVALSGAMGAENARHLSAFRAFRTFLRDGFRDYGAPYVSIDVLLTWSTSRFSHVSVEHHERVAGKSNYSVGRLLSHAFNMITGFSILPLQIASVLGLSATVLGGGILAFVLVRWAFFGSTVAGFTFLASAIAIFAGIQLFALGLIGEYVARIHVRSLGRPAYVLDEAATGPDPS
jgi:undecaprenyl-phosphate 4-deoxy-4-formamido-L-arabinose transferase